MLSGCVLLVIFFCNVKHWYVLNAAIAIATVNDCKSVYHIRCAINIIRKTVNFLNRKKLANANLHILEDYSRLKLDWWIPNHFKCFNSKRAALNASISYHRMPLVFVLMVLLSHLMSFVNCHTHYSNVRNTSTWSEVLFLSNKRKNQFLIVFFSYIGIDYSRWIHSTWIKN